MPSMSMPLSPQLLQGFRPPAMPPSPEPPISGAMMPPDTPPLMARKGGGTQAPKHPIWSPFAAPMGPPDQLMGLTPGSMPPSPQAGAANPFQGNQNPGEFITPAPFNPLLAQILLGRQSQHGQYGGPMPSFPMMPRGPMGAFGLAPESQRPRSQRNPYRGTQG